MSKSSLRAEERLQVELVRVVEQSIFRREPMPSSLRDALLASPRDRFIAAYQMYAGGEIYDPADGDNERHLERLYSDTNIGYASSDHDVFPSTNTSPSENIQALHLMGVEAGQRVLEVGSGGGYVLGLLSHLVGSSGTVQGVEIIPELAALSRAALNGLGRTNVEVVCQDADAFKPDGLYDRIIFNTAVWNIPSWLFAATAPGARVMIPLQGKAFGDDSLLLRRDESGFRSLHASHSWFVSPTGGLATREPLTISHDEALRRAGGAQSEILRCAMPFGESGFGKANAVFAIRTASFQSYLAKSGPGFFSVGEPSEAVRISIDVGVNGFGLTLDDGASVALLSQGELVGYGRPKAFVAFVEAYARWTDMLMPGVEAFDAIVRSAEPSADAPGYHERRGPAFITWTVKPQWPSAVKIIGELATVQPPNRA